LKVKLLAIDDEAGVLEMIRSHFELRGYEVFTASDGDEGIQLCKAVKPDVVLLDIKMKKMDGDKALPDLRCIVPNAKIFVVSAYQDEVTEKRIAGLGADAYFEKPLSLISLEDVIKNAVIKTSSRSDQEKIHIPDFLR
jgi:DNA-binding response OmpR family regulator